MQIAHAGNQDKVARIGCTAKGKASGIEWDGVVPGLGQRNGKWLVKKRPKGSRTVETVVLGPVARYTRVQARRWADEEVLPVLARGESYAGLLRQRKACEREQMALQVNTFGKVADDFIKSRKRRENTVTNYRRILTSAAFTPIYDKPIAEITTDEIAACVRSVADRGKAAMSNRVISLAISVFNFAVSWDLVARNPANKAKVTDLWTKPVARRRTLISKRDMTEVRTLYRRADELGPVRGGMIKLLTLTGCRVGVLALSIPTQREALRWHHIKDIDGAEPYIEVPADLRKTGSRDGATHEIPLSPEAVAVLKSLPYAGPDTPVFMSSTGKPIRVDVSLRRGVRALLPDAEHFTLHDLRRTCATGLGGSNAPVEVIDRILDHVAADQSGIRGVYQQDAKESEKRDWLCKWAAAVAD